MEDMVMRGSFGGGFSGASSEPEPESILGSALEADLEMPVMMDV